MHDTFDVVVVGARVAGLTLAARLAAGGLTVALFDRDPLPAPTLSTHILHSTADLRTEGVYETLVAMGVPPLHEVRVGLDTLELRLTHPDDPGMCPRRDVLDQVLLDRAVAAGAKTFLGTPVTGVLRDDAGVVRGVRVQRPDGSAHDVLAQLVVGADGRNSSVARWVGARQYLASRSDRSLVWRYFTGRTIPPVLRWHRTGEHIISALPTGPEEFVLIAQPPQRLQEQLNDPDPETLVRHAERLSPVIGELARGAWPSGPLYRMVRYPCFFREPHGPGWVLVGDAGHTKDATLGHGINDALRNARMLAGVLLEYWADPTGLEEGLRDWTRERDRMELPNYWYGQDIGRGAAINDMERAILRGLARSPRAVRGLDNVMGDRMSADRLLHLGRLLAAGGRRLRSGDAPGAVARDVAGLVRLALERRRAAARHEPAAPAQWPPAKETS